MTRDRLAAYDVYPRRPTLSFLDRIERSLDRGVSNVFSRGGSIKPLDLAQGLKRECDDQIQVLDRARTLAPNTYSVYLNSMDYERFASWEDTLVDELQRILVDHADQQKYLFVGNVTVALKRDDDVKAGRFETESSTERSSLAPATTGGENFQPILEIDGQQYLLTGRVTVIGRGGDSDIILDDTGVSRHHLELRVDGTSMTATDLGSTNGTFVNGERITTPTGLPDGATIRIGRTRLTVILPTGAPSEW